MTEDVLNWIKKEKLMTEGDTVIVGLSGGADSVALLLVLLELRQRIGYTLLAIHVEHGIRGEESRKDAAFVEELCRQKNIPCRICPVNVPDYAATEGIGVEEAARILRYECYQKAAEELKQSGAGRVSIALAHHANDNAETVLFQMARGSGVHGMCGMHPKRVLGDDILIVRPLLCVSRGQIEEYLKKCGQEYRTDGTNLDINYSRNRIRHHILPELSVINEQAVSHINQSALLLQQAVSYMEQETKKVDETGLIRYIRILSELSNQIKYATQKRVLTEVTFVKLCVPQMEKNTQDDSVIARLDALEKKLENGIVVNSSSAENMDTVYAAKATKETPEESKPKVELPKMVSDDMKKINEKWGQIVSGLSVTAKSFLSPDICKKTVSQDGQTLILQFTDATAEAYFNMDEKKNLDELKILISNIVGVDAGIMAELVSPEQSRNSLDLSDLIDKINFDVQFKK